MSEGKGRVDQELERFGKTIEQVVAGCQTVEAELSRLPNVFIVNFLALANSSE